MAPGAYAQEALRDSVDVTEIMQVEEWSLRKCTEYAISHNREIIHQILQSKMQEADLALARKARIPSLTGGVQEIFHFGNTLVAFSVDANAIMSLTQLGAQFELPLFTGMQIPNHRKAMEWGLQASEQNIEVARVNVRIKVAAAYLQLLMCKSEVQLAKEQVSMGEKLLSRAKKLVEDGKKPKNEVSQAEADLSGSRFLLTQAEGNEVMARVALANLLNLEDHNAFDISAPDDPDYLPAQWKVDEIPFESILQYHPSVRAAEYNVKSSEYRVKEAKSYYYPNLSMLANYTTYFYAPFMLSGPAVNAGTNLPSGFDASQFKTQLQNNGWGQVGFRLTIPILSAFNVKEQVKKARFAQQDALTYLDETKLELGKQIREAYYSTVTAKERHVSAVAAESAYKTSMDYRQELYDVGRATLYDLSQDRLKWLKAQEEVLSAKYEYLLRSAILDIYIDFAE